MKFVDEYRDGKAAQAAAAAIRAITTRPWTLMEICGGQTHTIMKFGLEALLPPEIELIHGPGCPVCVTPAEMIDKALLIAARPEVTFTSYGDMLRVPGSTTDLLAVKASGGDVRIVYSPLDAVRLAAEHPGRKVVFFAVGFETTAPANAMAVREAHRLGLKNFSILCSQVRVPPALEAILSAPDHRVQGVLAAGHVCTVMGYEEYVPLARRYHLPVVVTGFEPVDILQGVQMAVAQLEAGRADVENQYSRVVRREGNRAARALMEEIFEVTDRMWRGIGVIRASGLSVRPAYAAYDAENVFDLPAPAVRESRECIAGLVLQGRRKPDSCAAFGRACVPEHPLGAPMVSSEGACAAYFRYEYQNHDRRDRS